MTPDEETNSRNPYTRRVNDANLTGALGKFSEAYKVSRAKAYEGIDFEELRGRIAELKSYAASHLDQLPDQFHEERRGPGRQGLPDQ